MAGYFDQPKSQWTLLHQLHQIECLKHMCQIFQTFDCEATFSSPHYLPFAFQKASDFSSEYLSY
jgi:hypothetical protein